MNKYDFVLENGISTETELAELLKIKAGGDMLAYMQYLTAIRCEAWSGRIDDVEHLLEIRLFSETREIRAVRSVIGEKLIWRVIDDVKFREKLDEQEFENKFGNRTYTEVHYLDIDSTGTGGKTYYATGGGKYTLPIENAERIEIRNYGVFDENGIFKLVDFRIVRLLLKKDGEE